MSAEQLLLSDLNLLGTQGFLPSCTNVACSSICGSASLSSDSEESGTPLSSCSSVDSTFTLASGLVQFDKRKRPLDWSALCQTQPHYKRVACHIPVEIDSVIEPHLAAFERLPNDSVQVFWQLPLLSQRVSLKLCCDTLKPLRPRHKYSSVRAKLRNLVQLPTNALKTAADLDGTFFHGRPSTIVALKPEKVEKLGTKQADVKTRHIFSFPEISLKPAADSEVSSTRINTFSYTLDNLEPGLYSVHVSGVTNVDETDYNSCFPYFGLNVNLKTGSFQSEAKIMKVLKRPQPPKRVTALLHKAKTGDCEETENTEYEAFVVVSWDTISDPLFLKPTKRGKSKAGSGGVEDELEQATLHFSVSIEVLDKEQNGWITYGDSMEIDSERTVMRYTATVVALPEVSEKAPQRSSRCNSSLFLPNVSYHHNFEKFRIKVQAVGQYSNSEPAYSAEIPSPKVNLSETSIDFQGCDEVFCCICQDNIIFHKDFRDLDKLVVTKTQINKNSWLSRSCQNVVGDNSSGTTYEVRHTKPLYFQIPVSPESCPHLFHLGCILKWAQRCFKRDRPLKMSSCPYCNQSFSSLVQQCLEPETQNFRTVFPNSLILCDEETSQPLRRHKSLTLHESFSFYGYDSIQELATTSQHETSFEELMEDLTHPIRSYDFDPIQGFIPILTPPVNAAGNILV